jgi:hypothetical protein
MLAWLALAASPPAGAAEERANYFDDPFVQVTGAIAHCPVPPGPQITRKEMRIEAHERAERGTRCYQEGFCRLPNAYQYDREIIPRVRRAIEVDGRYADSSIWIEGQRRWVWLKGCVRRASDKAALEKLVRRVDDVEAVVDELVVKPAHR